MSGRLILGLALLAIASAAYAVPPPDRIATLARGINLTNWFRYPARADDQALRTYLDDAAITALRRAGFSFVRLAVQPELLEAMPGRLGVLIEETKRLQRAGLAVVLGPHPSTWHLEQSPADQARLLAFWRHVAPALRPLDPRLTFPELLNEPVFDGAAAGWEALQTEALAIVRTTLPGATVVLTGADWGGIEGLAALHPAADPNVVTSFHFYEPVELTALAAYRPGLDRAALARLPFPMKTELCQHAATLTQDTATRALIDFTCSLHWDEPRIDARIERAAAWARDNHQAILLGEFGASRALNAPARLAWLDAVRRACARRGIGWALWGYDDAMGFGIDPRKRPRMVMDHATLSALGLDNAP
jgi:endoglucanase